MLKDAADLYRARGEGALEVLHALSGGAVDALDLTLLETPEGSARERYRYAKEHVLPLLLRLEDEGERGAALQDAADGYFDALRCAVQIARLLLAKGGTLKHERDKPYTVLGKRKVVRDERPLVLIFINRLCHIEYKTAAGLQDSGYVLGFYSHKHELPLYACWHVAPLSFCFAEYPVLRCSPSRPPAGSLSVCSSGSTNFSLVIILSYGRGAVPLEREPCAGRAGS